MDIENYVYKRLQKKYKIKETDNIEDINYIDMGYIDSLGLIQFIFDLEEKFDIEFTEKEMHSEDFRKIGPLIQIIKKKVDNVS